MGLYIYGLLHNVIGFYLVDWGNNIMLLSNRISKLFVCDSHTIYGQPLSKLRYTKSISCCCLYDQSITAYSPFDPLMYSLYSLQQLHTNRTHFQSARRDPPPYIIHKLRMNTYMILKYTRNCWHNTQYNRCASDYTEMIRWFKTVWVTFGCLRDRPAPRYRWP